jgi:hypothetical protein
MHAHLVLVCSQHLCLNQGVMNAFVSVVRTCLTFQHAADLSQNMLHLHPLLVILSQADKEGCCLVVTTGGTGPAPRDVTPEATEAVCSRMLPGYGEQMRAISLKYVPTAVLSRQTAGKGKVVSNLLFLRVSLDMGATATSVWAAERGCSKLRKQCCRGR